uniref:Venom protein family 28 protein 1 n=1 Tax=Lethocerus distinctifemur TaxID=280095 RepID=A0A2K8JLC5_9HEMI|nr:venom protein family 28 protein 1 [Lethocerus distinctifemur]
MSNWGKLCALALVALVLAVHSADGQDDRTVQTLKNHLISIKKMIADFKKSGSLSYSCKSGECELKFKGKDKIVTAKITYGTSGDKKGFFNFILGINNAEVSLPAIKTGGKGTVVCSKAPLGELCVKLNDLRTNLANEFGTANVCFELQIAGTNIFHACVTGVKGRLTANA